MSEPLLSQLLVKSPLRALQQHGVIAGQCVAALKAFMEAAGDQDWPAADNCYNNLARLEQSADDIKKDLRLHLPRSIMMSVPREGVLMMLHTQDKIANHCQDAAGLIYGRKIEIPGELAPQLVENVELASASVDALSRVLEQLMTSVAAGFGSWATDSLETTIDELDKIENHSDVGIRELRHQLFSMEAKLESLDVIHLYQVIDLIAGISDASESAGHLVLTFIAR